MTKTKTRSKKSSIEETPAGFETGEFPGDIQIIHEQRFDAVPFAGPVSARYLYWRDRKVHSFLWHVIPGRQPVHSGSQRPAVLDPVQQMPDLHDWSVRILDVGMSDPVH